MRTTAIPILIATLAISPLLAEDEPEPWSGDVEVGYRSASVSGNEDKYREDVNLDDGGRLLRLDLSYRPETGRAIDELRIWADGLGGDPRSSAGFRLRGAGRYDLKARYRSTDFFYRDAGYFFSGIGDLHSWDAKREFLDVDMSVEATSWLTLRAGGTRTERTGDSTTSRDVQRDEFVLERPVDQESTAYWLGADARFGWADLTLEHRATSYENRWLLTTADAEGIEPDGAFLTEYRQLQLQDADQPVSRIAFGGAPSDRVRFDVGYARSDAELDHSVEGEWSGTDFVDLAFATVLTNTGIVERDSELWDLRLFLGLTSRVDLTLDAGRRTYEQDGTIDYREEQTGGEEEGLIVVEGDLRNELELDRYRLTLNWRVGKAWSLTAGTGLQTRTAAFELSGPEIETERSLARAGIRYRPRRSVDLDLQYETGEDDEPYTRVSPTDLDRLRLRARLRPTESLEIRLHARNETRENLLAYPLAVPTDDVPPAGETARAEFEVRSWGASAAWNLSRTDLYLGYTRTEVDADADIVYVTGATFFPQFDVFTTLDRTAYVSEQDAISGMLRVRPGKRWTASVNVSVVTNDGTFPLDWMRYGASARHLFPGGFYLRLRYDRYDLDETNPYAGPPEAPTPDVNDYDADLWTASVGYEF